MPRAKRRHHLLYRQQLGPPADRPCAIGNSSLDKPTAAIAEPARRRPSRHLRLNADIPATLLAEVHPVEKCLVVEYAKYRAQSDQTCSSASRSMPLDRRPLQLPVPSRQDEPIDQRVHPEIQAPRADCLIVLVQAFDKLRR